MQVGRPGTPSRWIRFLVVPLGDVVLVHGDDISVHRAATNALIESEERYRSLFESANEGIALVDLEGRITEANHAFLVGCGQNREELIGSAVLDLIFRNRSGKDRSGGVGGQPGTSSPTTSPAASQGPT